MSKENRPNFNAVKFVVDIIESYQKSMRGEAKFEDVGMLPTDMISEFVEEVNLFVDARVTSTKRKK